MIRFTSICFHSQPVPAIAGLVDCNSGIESERHAPGVSGQGKVLTNKHSDSRAIARICNAAMIVARMAGTPIITVTVHYGSEELLPRSLVSGSSLAEGM